MAARMEKTRHPGIFKRGSRYVVTYRVNGAQRKESARTLEEARRIKAARTADRDRGEFQAESRIAFRDYAEEWIERYRGNGKRGFTENTREHYRRDLAKRAYPFFDERLGRTISGITPRDVDRFIAWLCDEQVQGVRLADATIRRTLAPLRSCLATARREGLIRHNPADGAVLPQRDEQRVTDGEEPEKRPRALTRAQLAVLLERVPERHRLLIRFLVATGLRWSELVGLRWRDLDLEGDHPAVHVRRAIVPRLGRKEGESPWRVKPPKSKHGKRSIPLRPALVRALLAHQARTEWPGDDDLVFGARNGEPLRHGNLRLRMLHPAARRAGVEWVGFHTFRHTAASLLFEAGRNPKQIQHWLGHHSAAFTLDTYAHLLDAGLGDGLDLEAELAQGGNKGATDGVRADRIRPETLDAKPALESQKGTEPEPSREPLHAQG